jgi:tRNA nucleotidyltransferase/poly(A) polymerase
LRTIQLPEWPWRVVRKEADKLDVAYWLVGGAVRDLLLGRAVHDWDFAVDRDAMTLARAVGDALGGAFFPLDEERGTARVVLNAEAGASVVLDFALLRGGSLDADLLERDFTVNAMAVGEAGMLLDPLDGRVDLEAGRIRATSEDAFRDDPVRVLRAVRLESELGFTAEPQTESWIERDAPLLVGSAAERLRDELTRGLAVSGAADFIRRLDELSLLIHLLPEVNALKGLTRAPSRPDVWRHTMVSLDTLEHVIATVVGKPSLAGPHPSAEVPPSAWEGLARRLGRFAGALESHLSVTLSADRDRQLLLKLAAVFHDVGKSRTRSVGDEGRVQFYGHASTGGRLTDARMRALRFSTGEATHVRAIVEAHSRPARLARGETVTRRTIYRYFRDTGDAGVDTVLLGLADRLAAWGPDLEAARWCRLLEVAELLLHHFFERRQETVTPELPVDGHDLMRALDLEPGPEVGRLLALLREAVAAGEVETEEEALQLARESARPS